MHRVNRYGAETHPRPFSGLARDDDPANPAARADARVRAGADHPAGVERSPSGGGGIVVSGAASHVEGRLGIGGVGSFGAQSAGAHLQDHSGGAQTTGAGSLRVRAHAGRHRARDESGPIMKRLMERLRLRRSIEDELNSYLEEKVTDLVESGVPEGEARLRARREFGNTTRIAEDSRAALGWSWIEHAMQDLRYALRMLRRSPAFTTVAILSLALGIGANTAFGLLDTLVLRMLPVRNPEQLWAVSLVEGTGRPHTDHSYPLFALWRDHTRSME